MYQNYNQYLQWMQNCIQSQEQRIKNLETMIQQLSEELKLLKEKPTIHIDTIEYKFDQLKVETLEGTLNIGLNPSDMGAIEDLAVKNHTLSTPNPKAYMERSMEIEDAMLGYLETDLQDIIQDTGSRLNIEATEEYLNFIKEDIKKQLPSRIDSHVKACSPNEQSIEDIKNNNQKIIDLLKQEIKNGVSIFLNHLPENMKGMNQE
ncbi:MAG: spore germination protein GerPC [Bacillota bacterium]|nr:spore germination protein GerPC [Bacillota bacterium]